LINKKFKRFLTTDLYKSSVSNGIANGVQLLVGIVSNKVVAVIIGPSGIAFVAHFNNLIQMVSGFVAMGMPVAVTKYVAEYGEDEEAQKRLFGTAFYLSMASLVICISFILVQHFYFLGKIFKGEQYQRLFLISAPVFICFVFNGLITSLINGRKKFQLLAITNIISSLIGAAIMCIGVYYWGVIGACYATLLNALAMFIVYTLFIYCDKIVITFKYFTSFDPLYIRNLLKYFLMALSGIYASYMIFEIRGYLIKQFSLDDAGYWQAIVRISDHYLAFITSTLGIYYLPRLSEIKDDKEIKRELYKGFIFILPIVVFSSVVIYFLRDFIIYLLFAPSFYPMRDLFLFQMLGNVLKIASWLLSYLMLAKAMTRLFIVTEIVFSSSFLLLTIILTDNFGLVGVTYSYFVNYLIYLIVMIFIFRKYIF
jgi:O-antigen/teichoic acid export membrane protein